MNKKRTIIIGAGPAGLTAAYELSRQPDQNVLLLEESNEIGGIARTIQHKGNRMDIGGHRFFSKSDTVMNWWDRIMPLQGKPSADDLLLNRHNDLPTGGPDPEKQDRVMLVRRRVSRIYYLRKFFDYPISLRLETFVNMGAAKTIRAGLGYLRSTLRKRKEYSLEDFYINRFGKPLYNMFFEHYTEKVWGIHPSRLEADWGAQRVKGLSLMGLVWNVISKPFVKDRSVKQKGTETSLIEQFIYPKYGPGQLWETVAADAEKQGVVLKKEHTVVGIRIENKRVVSVVTENRGTRKEIPCDLLVSSMPLKDLVAAINNEEPEAEIKQIASELPYRDFITVGLLVDKLAIRNRTKIKTWNNLVPDTWIYIQEPDVKIGRLQIFNNWSPYMVADFKNKVWLGLEYFCNEGDDLWEMTDDEFVRLAIQELASIGIIHEEDVADSVRVKVKKAYPAYHGSYNRLDKVTDYLNGIDNLYCIGRNGQHRYNNMDHSMLTAMMTCKHIAGEITDKKSIWNVNTEQDYHESKKSIK